MEGHEHNHHDAGCGARLDKIEHVLFGNGEPGMDEHIRSLAHSVQQMTEERIIYKANTMWTWIHEMRERDKMRASALYIAAVSGVVSLLLQLVESL